MGFLGNGKYPGLCCVVVGMDVLEARFFLSGENIIWTIPLANMFTANRHPLQFRGAALRCPYLFVVLSFGRYARCVCGPPESVRSWVSREWLASGGYSCETCLSANITLGSALSPAVSFIIRNRICGHGFCFLWTCFLVSSILLGAAVQARTKFYISAL